MANCVSAPRSVVEMRLPLISRLLTELSTGNSVPHEQVKYYPLQLSSEMAFGATDRHISSHSFVIKPLISFIALHSTLEVSSFS